MWPTIPRSSFETLAKVMRIPSSSSSSSSSFASQWCFNHEFSQLRAKSAHCLKKPSKKVSIWRVLLRWFLFIAPCTKLWNKPHWKWFSNTVSSHIFWWARRRSGLFWVQRLAREISLCTSPWGKVKCGKNARWLSVWCETYDVSFGHVLFPTSLKWIQLPTYFGVGSCTIGTSRQKIYWIVLHRASSSKKSWDWVSSSASCLDSCLADENAQDQNDKHDK